MLGKNLFLLGLAVSLGKDKVRRVYFGVFSTSHFPALSSDWKVLSFRHRHFFVTHRGEKVHMSRHRHFLGPRGPLVLPLVDPPVCSSVRKENLDHLYTSKDAL